MTYFQIINNEEKTICVNEKEPLFLVRICKQHSYQDSALEERAMYDLSPTGFMLYCLMSMKPPQYIWSFSVSKLPFDIDTLKKAIEELFSVGYMARTKHELIDIYGESVEIDGYVFYENPIESKRR